MTRTRTRARAHVHRMAASVVAAGFVALLLTLGATPADAAPPQVKRVDTGMFEGRFWVQIELVDPFPEPEDLNSVGAAFSVFTPGGVHLSGHIQNHRGTFSQAGAFAPDSTFQPNSPADVEIHLSEDRRVVTFFFEAPPGVAFDAKTLTWRTQTSSQQVDGGPIERFNEPADGIPVAFDTTERNPLAPPRTDSGASSGPSDGDSAKGGNGTSDQGADKTGAADATSGDDGIPVWVWALVAVGGLLGLAGAIWLMRRPQPMTLEEALTDVRTARALLDDLATDPPPRERGGWIAYPELVRRLDKIQRGLPKDQPALRAEAADAHRDAVAMAGTGAKNGDQKRDSWDGLESLSSWSKESGSGLKTIEAPEFVPSPEAIADLGTKLDALTEDVLRADADKAVIL